MRRFQGGDPATNSHRTSMRIWNYRMRRWAGGLAILAFSVLLYMSIQFLTATSVYTSTATFNMGVWKTTDYRISLRNPVLTALGCNATTSVSPMELKHVEIVEEALSLRPTFKGFQNKAEMLDPIKWRPEFKQQRQNETRDWAAFQKKHANVPCEMVQPPLQFPGCLVHINHNYRFIWIKGKKVGGTTIREPLGWICGDHWMVPKNANMEFCSERWYTNHTVSIAKARKYWKDYFVFAFVRNPYSRYGSSYTYIEGMKGSWSTNTISFEDACRQPFLQAFIANSGEGYTHHIHHIMEQASCLFTQEGLPAVDFVGETEFLYEDLQIVLDEINRRKHPDLPDLKMPEHLRTKNANRRQDYAVPLYMDNPECFQEVEKHFSMDFQRLGYEPITERVAHRLPGKESEPALVP